jgi:predicted XRE-type DNA-binding protein
MNTSVDTSITRGSANVFADLGFADAQTHLLKAGLVSRIQSVLAANQLTQTDAARCLGISQPDVSRLLRGHFRDVSVERLLRMLTKLGCEIDIAIKSPGGKVDNEPIHLHALVE